VRLEVDQVTAAYGDAVALRDVSLVVPSGSVVALLGPNGAGKTTLLSVASGLLRPRRGRVLLDGRDVTGEPPASRVARGMCHVTEGRSIFPALTVADNLRMFARGGAASDAIDLALTGFPKLRQRLRQTAGTMSGGEQQMLAMSRAYVSQPAVVLLDEVSMGLAPMVIDEIFAFLSTLVSAGTTVLLVEQYVAKALELADFVYLMLRGRVVYAGEPGETSPAELSARYLGSGAPA
jgi:branched-chain amino acid transport system ATP-binding protein